MCFQSMHTAAVYLIGLFLYLSFCAYTETKMESITLPELPTPISIQDQFDKRSVYVLTEPEEEKLCSNNWLTNLIADDSDAEEQDDR